MNSGVRWKYASAICFSVKFKGGTTEAIAIPSIDLKSSSASEKRFRACTPHSSTVRERAVVRRQCAASVSPSKTPSDVLVLPMSITSNIRIGCRDLVVGFSHQLQLRSSLENLVLS